ncbi:hypothetical protein RclHR1_13880002 [Rhizophagus clarus]|uniref:DUF7431 domain-containing protein n=1 Tax=Rhizophagus clarus TaxID=94130 RepID=A0A2Z6QB57_9GLOM|nr:hypothetical protein RclHR1_13880002 [Rhizophagus clarus]GES99731.1 hypothetical protein GLOIN_2v1471308 [Rhizophagus clarus]
MSFFLLKNYFSKKYNVEITVEYTGQEGQEKFQQNKFVRLNLSDDLSEVRQQLEKRDIINSTLSFIRKFSENGKIKFAEIEFEDEKVILLEKIVRRSENTHILTLMKCSKFNWKVMNKLHKLDHGCTMTFDGIKKADKRAFEMKDCIFEIGDKECETGEFISKSIEDLMKDKNLFFNADVNIHYFVKMGTGVSIETSKSKESCVETNYSYRFTKYVKASLKLKFEHLKATPEFIEVVENAISSEDPAEHYKQIIKDFGQFIPTEVILGGRVHFDDYTKSVRQAVSGNIKIKDLWKENSNNYSQRCTKIIGGEQPDDIENLDMGNWVNSLNKSYENWDCIEFCNPISIFQLLPKGLHERIIKSVGVKIHYSTIENCNLSLEEYRKPVEFKLNIPPDVKRIIRNEDIDYKIFATVTDITKSKNDFYTCQILCPSDGRLPSLIIHRVQDQYKIFKQHGCKLKIGWMIIGYYNDFNFDFNTRLDILHYDFNASDTSNLIEYDSKVPICLGIPVLSEYPKNESLIIGHYYYVQEEKDKNNKIKAQTFAYCLKDSRTVNLPNFTFYTLKITNYHIHSACETIILKRKEYNNFNTESPRFISIYSTEPIDCLFLKQSIGQIKIKKIGKDSKDRTKLSVKCAIFNPFISMGHMDELTIQEKSTVASLNTKNDQQDDESVKNLSNQSKLYGETKKYQQSENKDEVINKLQQQIEKPEEKLNEETRKYQASQDNFISKLKDKEEIVDKLQNKINEEKSSKLDEEKSKSDEETKKYQDLLEKTTALNDQLKNKDNIVNKLEQQNDELKRQLNEETEKYQVSQENLTFLNNQLKNREELIEEFRSKLDEESRKYQSSQNSDNQFKEMIILISQIRTKHSELRKLNDHIIEKNKLGIKQSNVILTNDNSDIDDLEKIKQKLNDDYELTKEEIQEILDKKEEEIRLKIQLESMIQEESITSSLNTKNDQPNEPAKNLSKQQIIQKFKLNHGLFLDEYSIKFSKNAIFIEDSKFNISLCKEQPFVYTFINFLSINSLQSSDICINFPVIEITCTADLSSNDDVTLYGHRFPRKILIGGKLFINDLTSATLTQIDMFKSFLIWAYDSAKYKKENPFNNYSAFKFFPKITTSDGENLNNHDKLTNWMKNLYQKNKYDVIISYNNLIPISTSSSTVDEIQPGVANFKEKLSLREWVKDSKYVNLTRWMKEFRLLQGLIINKHFELENNKKIAVKFINIPNVNSRDKLYLEMIKPITTLEEFLRSDDANKFLDKNLTLLPFIKKSIKSVNLSYEDYTHFMIKCERYRILFNKADVKPSEEFEQDIEKALESMKPFTFLQDVFDKYGYFFPLNIVLGKSLKNILLNSSLSFTFKKMESLFESLSPLLDSFNVSYFLTKKGNLIERADLPKWIQNTNDLEVIEFDNIISLYDILKEEQQRSINIILNTQNNTKIIMTGIDDLKDLNNNNTEHYKRININPTFENGDGKYEVFGSIVSKDKKENLKSDFFVRFGLYDINGFSAMIKTLNKDNDINITECYILWMIIGIPSELLIFSSRNRELSVIYIKESITLKRDNSDSDYSIKTSHQLSQGDIISINVYCSTTNFEPINVKLIGWSKNRIIFQILKPIYNNSNLNNSTSSIASSDDGEDSDSLTNIEDDIVIDVCVCILSSEYESLNIDNKEKECHFCQLNLIGYTLTKENFNG